MKGRLSRGRFSSAVSFVITLLVLQLAGIALKEYGLLGQVEVTEISEATESSHVEMDSVKMARDTVLSPKVIVEKVGRKSGSVMPFIFDPSTADSATFVKLGFTPKQAISIIRYRKMRGGFRSASDFASSYVVSESQFKRLSPYIHFEELEGSESKIDGGKKRYPIDINSADSCDLVALPGIGPYYASKIIQMRDLLGGIAHEDQLLDIYGFGEERIDLIRQKIIIDSNKVKVIGADTASMATLAKHPYLGEYVARAVLKFREINGSAMCTFKELVKNRVFRGDNVRFIRYYIR